MAKRCEARQSDGAPGEDPMAKTQETFRKRQRERKLREKAELKRQRREQRRLEKKDAPAELVPDAASVEFPEAPAAEENLN